MFRDVAPRPLSVDCQPYRELWHMNGRVIVRGKAGISAPADHHAQAEIDAPAYYSACSITLRAVSCTMGGKCRKFVAHARMAKNIHLAMSFRSPKKSTM